MIDASGTSTPGQPSNEGHAADCGLAPVISRRPAWADETRLLPDVIVHTWVAPTVACGMEANDGELVPIRVEVDRMDDLRVIEAGVILDPGVTRIFLLDTAIPDTTNGRLLAQAILECCDRIDAAGGER